MSRKQRVAHKRVVNFAQAHPEMLQKDIARHFNLSPNHVSLILRTAGAGRGHLGRPLKQKEGETNEKHHWEEVLRKAGLGMDEGLRINNQRILYRGDGRYFSPESPEQPAF